MNYDEFKENVKDSITSHLSSQYSNADVSLNEVHKNNVTLTGLIIKSEETNITPTIYLESFYKDYQNGDSMDNILDRIADTYEKNNFIEGVDVEKLTSIEEVKDHIFPRVVGIAENADLLANRPHDLVAADLALIYAVNLASDENGGMSIPITESLMNSYGLSKEELHDIALKNMDERMDITFKGMNEVMREMMIPDILNSNGGDLEAAEAMLENMLPPEEAMYVLGNNEKLNGAVTMFDTKTMDSISEKLEGDFYVLPSSVHEVIVVPMTDEISLEHLESMVKEVNANELSPEDKLSDNVYAYDSKEHELLRADQYNDRVNERNSEKTKVTEKEETRVSFKEQLADAKKEAKAIKETKKEKETQVKKKKSVSIED